jgi:hypothetical protein
MSVFDHLSILLGIFEAASPNTIALSLIGGLALDTRLFISRLKPLALLHGHTFLRWRSCFAHRLFQALSQWSFKSLVVLIICSVLYLSIY